MKDKSATHVLVEKNGVTDWIPKSVWAATKNDDHGFTEVPEAPMEVKMLSQKNSKPIVETEALEIAKKKTVTKEVDTITGVNENKEPK